MMGRFSCEAILCAFGSRASQVATTAILFLIWFMNFCYSIGHKLTLALLPEHGVYMLKPIIKSFFIAAFIISPVFAHNDAQSSFHQQELTDSAPIGEESYFATLSPMESKSGGYFGLNLGALMSTLKTEIEITKAGLVNSKSQNKSVIGYTFGLYDGYGVNINHFYIGAELGAGYNSSNKSFTDVVNGCNTELSVKQPIVMSLDLIPGYMTYNRKVLFYGRLGLGGSYFKLKFSDTTDPSNVVGNTTNKITFGMRAGVGIEYFMGDYFSIRTEYVYTEYNKVKGLFDGANKYEYRINSSGSNQLNLGLSIHY